MERIGILGGTFDPVHNGHLRLAIEMGEALGLSRVKLMVAPNPRLRARPRAPAATRIRMLEAALEGVESLEIDSRELARAGPTASVKTLESLRAESPEAVLWLIVGMDAFSRFDRWTQWARIPELAHIAVANRPGAAEPGSVAVRELLEQRRTSSAPGICAKAGAVAVIDIPALDISATRVRALRARGASVRFLVPDPVNDIILEEDLYARDH